MALWKITYFYRELHTVTDVSSEGANSCSEASKSKTETPSS